MQQTKTRGWFWSSSSSFAYRATDIGRASKYLIAMGGDQIDSWWCGTVLHSSRTDTIRWISEYQNS